MSPRRCALLTLLLSLGGSVGIGCNALIGLDQNTVIENDSGASVGADSSVDSAADSAPDSTLADTGRADSPGEATPDVNAEATSLDATMNDAATDGADASVSPDAADAGADSAADTGPDSADTGPEAGVDSAADTGADTSVDAGPTDAAPTWSTGCTMTIPRSDHVGILLGSGKVLLAGGDTTSTTASPMTAELFDPATGKCVATGTMASTHGPHAVVLQDGRVLVVGGGGWAGWNSSAEIYDPDAGAFGGTGPMATARRNHGATLLSSGKVLVTGGENPFQTALSSAEVYDPGSGMFTSAGTMKSVRANHTATLLQDGTVLIAGGWTAASQSSVTASAELYDPVAGTFTLLAASMTAPRWGHTATLLPSGDVLLTGGAPYTYGYGGITNSAETYHPATKTFTATASAMGASRIDHTATLLPGGQVLVVGGDYDGCAVDALSELYDPTARTFSPSATMSTGRTFHGTTLLQNGQVFASGGITCNCGGCQTTALGSTELYH